MAQLLKEVDRDPTGIFWDSRQPGARTRASMTAVAEDAPRLETYVSLDLEVDGEAPGLSSMLSLAAAAVHDGAITSTFSANLVPLPGARPHPDTMAFWAGFPEELERARRDPRPPEEVIPEFVEWVEGLGAEELVAVGAPAAFDFAWVNWYCHRFAGRNPLGYACLDLLSLAMGRLGADRYWDLENRIHEALQVLADPARRHHVALDDAVEQARLLIAWMEVQLPKRA